MYSNIELIREIAHLNSLMEFLLAESAYMQKESVTLMNNRIKRQKVREKIDKLESQINYSIL